MGFKSIVDDIFTSKHDFNWVYTDFPHTIRRKAILEKYPQVKTLFGHDWRIALQCVLTVLFQIFMCYLISDSPWSRIVLVAYFIGGTCNHSLSLSLHEISHNLAFGHSYPLANRILGFISNMPMGIAASITFKKYHTDHHRYLGDSLMDPDIASEFECKLFSSTLGKIIFIMLQPVTYSIRPMLRVPKKIHILEIVNWIVQLTFNFCIYYFFGYKSLIYLILGTALGLGLHPISGHFIAEHFVFVKGYETYSYYGPLNFITFNVGYHNEHHDFPNIPCYKLPLLKKMAPEFYDNIPCHYSWIKVLYDFITCEDMGPYSRNKRKTKFTQEYATSTDRQYCENVFLNEKDE